MRWAWVEAPANEYIGLLPIKHQGRLICPAGTFGGFFFSEELRFALKHGYTLRGIEQAWQFQRGENTFRTLIEPNEGDSSIRRKACNPKCGQINDELHVWKVWHAQRRGNLNLYDP